MNVKFGFFINYLTINKYHKKIYNEFILFYVTHNDKCQ